ncbi:MAG: tRNA lysidine(34) synthetase TilS [Candidatus Omnitrophica bacterium]|nr:tRNA lysidine(34) synthetase TilS [Candidatus Omnitrophota bacterium]
MKHKQLSYSPFLKQVSDTIKQYNMLSKRDKVLVAVSGGADSVCLLKVLLDLKRSLGIEVIVGNVDHCLRGRESARDSEFVKKLSKELGVKCFYKKINVKVRTQSGMSLEESARLERYGALREFAGKSGCNVIATGHTMDDQAETVLLRIIYGSSTKGLAGIPPVRYDGDVRVIRPLLRLGKKDIVGFLSKNGLNYVEDSSNKETMFLRNKIRLKALPYLEKLNPKIRRALVNLADTLREDMDFVEAAKKGSLEKIGVQNMIAISDFLLQPKIIQKEIFKELFRLAGGDVKRLSYRHWIDMDRFVAYSEKGKSLDLPGNVRVKKTAHDIIFDKK